MAEFRLLTDVLLGTWMYLMMDFDILEVEAGGDATILTGERVSRVGNMQLIIKRTFSFPSGDLIASYRYIFHRLYYGWNFLLIR